jgi:hypothetical protein
MRISALLFVALALAACNEPKDQGPAASSTQTKAAPTPAPTPTEAPKEAAIAAPDDLDVAGLEKALKCGAAKSGPCAILAAFAGCTPWPAVVPSGDGRWLGRGYLVEGSKTSESITLLRSRSVPTSEIGPGQLPVRVGFAELAKQDGQAFEQADKAIRTLARHDVPARGNATIEHLAKRDAWSEGFSMRTVGGQVYVASQGGAFLCQGPHQELLLVQRAATRGSPGDGLYAELWPVSW